MAGKPRAVPNRTKKDVVAYTKARAVEAGVKCSERLLSRELNKLVDIIIELLVQGHTVQIGLFGHLTVEQYRANGHVIVRRRRSSRDDRVGTRIRGTRALTHHNLTDKLYQTNGNIALSGLVVMGLGEYIYRRWQASEKVEIRGLGTFKWADEKRPDRNKPVRVPAFKPALSLRDRINAELTDRAKARLRTR